MGNNDLVSDNLILAAEVRDQWKAAFEAILAAALKLSKALKTAFFETFRGKGEIFFPYEDLATAEECDAVVQDYFEEFIAALKGEQVNDLRN